jgi:hypothetical protein
VFLATEAPIKSVTPANTGAQFVEFSGFAPHSVEFQLSLEWRIST